MKVLYPITLDVKKTNVQKHIKAFTSEGGTRELIITLVSGNDTIELTNEYVVSVVGVKPDGTEFANTATVSDGKIHYTLTTQNLAVEGEVDCHIRVVKTNELLYTSKFAIDVEKNLSDEETETSSNEWTELIEALNRVNNMSIVWSGEGAPSTDPEEYPDIEESNFYYDETNNVYYYATNVSTTVTWKRIYNKDEVDAALDLKADKSTTYTKTEVDTALLTKADKSTTYTKTEVDTALSSKQNTLSEGNGIAIYNDEIGVALESGISGNILGFNNDEYLTLHGDTVAKDANFKTELAKYVYTETEVDNLLAAKQALLTAGNGIDLNNNTISAKVYSSSDNALSNSSYGLMVSKAVLGYDQTIREGLVNTSISNPLASKSYVDNLITTNLKYEVVQTLPTEDIDTHTIYLVPKSTSQTNNIYDEYMYINNAWELIGSTEVDLSNYYTKTESNTKFQDKLTAGANITISSSNVISASGGGNPITDTAKGSTISLTDSADSPLDAISIMGKSTQNGTPTIDNPIPIVDITQEEIEITNGTDTQSATLTKTLRGIPVSSGGNYTDNNNQQWICDTIERYKDGTGKYIQRVARQILPTRFTKSSVTGNFNLSTSLLDIEPVIPSQGQDRELFFNMFTTQDAYIVYNNYVTVLGRAVSFETAQEFNEYFTQNPLEIVYKIATPIETPLTSEELAELNLDTYYPSTTITANADVVVEYVCDTKTLLDKKQNKLTAGQNITIQDDVISASGELSIDYNEATNKPQINSTTLSGNKTSSDLGLQDKLTAGTNITIDSNNVISASGGGLSYTFTDGLTESSGTVGIDLKSGTELQITNDQLDIDLSSYATTTDLSSKQATIDSTHKLSADLVDDTNTTNKFVSAQEKQGWNAKADTSDIPTNVSELTNDSGYQTSSDVQTAISGKEDKTTISTDTTSTTVSLTLADNHEYRYTQDLTSLTLTMPSGDFISSIVFASGSTPTQMTYDSSIKWSGDDVTSNAFVPVASKTYNIVMWYDGINVNGVVRGV